MRGVGTLDFGTGLNSAEFEKAIADTRQKLDDDS